MNRIFQEVFECSPVATLVVQASGEIVLVNRQAEALFQYARKDLIGKPVEILVPEDVRARHPELVRTYAKAPLPRQMGQGRELHGVRRDGSMFPVEVGLNPIEKDGRMHVLASVIDISDRQRAEERFKAAFEAAPNGMLMINSSRRIVLLNGKIEEIFGYRREELVGNLIEMLVPEDFRAPHPKFVETFFRNPESRAMGIGRELHGRHRSGRLVPVEIGLQPILSGGETFVISSVVDISHRKQAEEEIKRKREELEEFAYRTSHDLRSPLKSISGMADVAAEQLAANDVAGASGCIARITSLTGKLLNLIEDILTLTRIDTEDQPVAAFDFDEYAKLAMDKFGAALQETGVRFEWTIHQTKALVVQPTRLTQVLDNLVGNAIKYADPGKPARHVRLLTFHTADRYVVQVVDNGTGIPADRQAEVFGMFKRFHGSSIPGSGLGLYMVRKQAARLGAKLTFESSPAGTTFYLEFPFDRAP